MYVVKIQIEVSEKNEGTESPWWMIVEPLRGSSRKAESVAHCITGPFFSREAAERELQSRSYDYHKDAIVWCASGYHSGQYKLALRSEKAAQELNRFGQ
jgi:hypothetical protein